MINSTRRHQNGLTGNRRSGTQAKQRSFKNGRLATSIANKMISQLLAETFKTKPSLIYHEARVLTIAFAQADIREPGINPRAKTAKPFTLKTIRISALAEITL